jgi:DNA repair exonuclease SbcCD ATPase subunit
MNEVYKSLKLRVQDTLQWGKAGSMPLAPVKDANALSLNHEMERLQRLVAAVTEGEAMVLEGSRQAEQLAGSLQADIAALEAKLKEKEEAIERENFARQKLEESLTAKIKELQNDIKTKDETLATRDKEINDYKFKIDNHVKQIGELELGNRKTKEQAAKRAEDLAASYQAKISALESDLNENVELARQKESTIKELEQNLAAKVQEFESVVKDKQELVTHRDAEINDLKSQLKRLTKGIGEMSSFFKQAEALASIEGQDVSTVAQNKSVDGAEEKVAAVLSSPAKITPIVPDAAGEMVSPEVFQRIASELAEVTDVILPLASLIVRRQVKVLGEAMEKFPKTRLPELLESLAKEITDERQQIDFRGRLAENAQWTLN